MVCNGNLIMSNSTGNVYLRHHLGSPSVIWVHIAHPFSFCVVFFWFYSSSLCVFYSMLLVPLNYGNSNHLQQFVISGRQNHRYKPTFLSLIHYYPLYLWYSLHSYVYPSVANKIEKEKHTKN